MAGREVAPRARQPRPPPRRAAARRGGDADGGAALGLEQRLPPGGEPASAIDAWLGDAELSIAYPGAWLRDDVYATHGHYMDCHMSLPRIECIAAAAVMRAFGPVPRHATAADYERVLRPIFGFSFGLAQSGLARRATRPSEGAWRKLSGRDRARTPVRRAAVRAAVAGGIPATVWTLNRLLRADFDPDLSATAIARSGIDAATELARRLAIGAAHVITGHTHRAGPEAGEARVGPSRRRPPPQHRQLDLRLRLPPPRHAAGPLLAGDGDLARGRGAAAPRAAARRARPRGAEGDRQRRALSALSSALAEPLGDDRADLLALVLLQVVAGVLDLARRRVAERLGNLLADREAEARGPSRPRGRASAARPRAAPSPPSGPRRRRASSGRSAGSAGKARVPAFDSRLG